MEEASKKASMLVDNAATGITYAYRLPIKTLYEFYYFKELEHKTDKELRSWGIMNTLQVQAQPFILATTIEQ